MIVLVQYTKVYHKVTQSVLISSKPSRKTADSIFFYMTGISLNYHWQRYSRQSDTANAQRSLRRNRLEIFGVVAHLRNVVNSWTFRDHHCYQTLDGSSGIWVTFNWSPRSSNLTCRNRPRRDTTHQRYESWPADIVIYSSWTITCCTIIIWNCVMTAKPW